MSPEISRQPLTAIDFYDGIQYHLGYFTTGLPVPGEGKDPAGLETLDRNTRPINQDTVTAMDIYAGSGLETVWNNRGITDSPFALSVKGTWKKLLYK